MASASASVSGCQRLTARGAASSFPYLFRLGTSPPRGSVSPPHELRRADGPLYYLYMAHMFTALMFTAHMGRRPITRAADAAQADSAPFALHVERRPSSIPFAHPETAQLANLSGDLTQWNRPATNSSILRTRGNSQEAAPGGRTHGPAGPLPGKLLGNSRENSRAPFAIPRAKGANSRGTTLLPASRACVSLAQKTQALDCCNGLPVEAYVR
ncbi:MAG: hypothetical protein PWR07_2064 [Bacillota bacterium]|nr:hypothetical protein [Bacillota bacterium]